MGGHHDPARSIFTLQFGGPGAQLQKHGQIEEGKAVELGLATRTSENPKEDALALAREIATKSPSAIRAGKKLLAASGVMSVEEGLRLEEKIQLTLIGKPNQLEAVRANLEKREPKFSDPFLPAQ